MSQALGASGGYEKMAESSNGASAKCPLVSKPPADSPHLNNANVEAASLKLFQFSPAGKGADGSTTDCALSVVGNDDVNFKPVGTGPKDVNDNRPEVVADLVEDDNHILAVDLLANAEDFDNTPKVLDGVVLDEPSTSSNELHKQLMDSVTTQWGELDQIWACCQVEKLLLEKDKKDYETVECGDGGERFVLYPDLEGQEAEPPDDVDGTSLGDAITHFIQSTDRMRRQRVEKWIGEIEGAAEDNATDGDAPLSISELPDEVLLKILSYISFVGNLTVVSLVCKRWYILAADPSFWRHLVIPSDRLIDPHWLGYLASKSPQLKSISIRDGRNVTPQSLSAVAQRCPLLTDVDFGFCNITTDMINCLVTCCPKIHIANFEGCESANSQWIQALCGLKKLRSLNISHCTHLVDDDIIYLSEHMSEFENVCIDGNSFLSDMCVKSLCTKHKDTLATLCIDGAESTDLSIEYAAACPNLYLFTISFADSLTNRSVDFLMTSKWLVHLQIRKNKLIEETALERLFASTSLQHLRHLDLTECLSVTDSVVRAICKRCPDLVKLVLGWCWNVTDEGVDCIVESLSNVHHLDLLGMDVIEGHSFDKLPAKLPRLTFLNLVQCNKIDDALILRVLERMPQLTAINFYHEDFRTAC